MSDAIYVFYQSRKLDGSSRFVAKQRTIRFRMLSGGGLPGCQWCKVHELRVLAKLVDEGVTIDRITAICWCDICEKATIIVYEAKTGDKSAAGYGPLAPPKLDPD